MLIRNTPFPGTLLANKVTTTADPFRFIDEAVSTLFREADTGNRPWVPAVDIVEDKDTLTLKADVPEVDPANVKIQIENGTLTLQGERKFENRSEEKGSYHRIERAYGSFARSFVLPDTVDPEKVSADYKHGVLTIVLPKKELAKPRSIEVKLS